MLNSKCVHCNNCYRNALSIIVNEICFNLVYKTRQTSLYSFVMVVNSVITYHHTLSTSVCWCEYHDDASDKYTCIPETG